MKNIFIFIILVGVVVGLSIYASKSPGFIGSGDSKDGGVCTQDLKSCPDGSYVGRLAPQCEFAKCPDEKITYNNTSADYIVVDLPFPGAVTGKEFRVMGKARRFYFEASFPVEVLDKDGNSLFIGPAQAQGEWMVDAFVPFEIDVKIPESYIGPATLVLHKDNPSGMPEYDASISFPIIIEY